MSEAPRRVIHVVDPSSYGGGGCTLRLARRTIDGLADLEHVVLCLGHDSQRRMAERCGLRPAVMVPVPAGATAMLALRLAREAWSGGVICHRTRQARASVVLAWSERALRASSLLVGAGDAVGATAWLSTARECELALHRTECEPLLAALAPSSRTGLACLGCEPGRDRIRVLEPCVQPEAASPRSGTAIRAALRARWGVRDGDLVLGLVGEPVDRCDARLACYASAITCVAGRRIRVLLHPLARGAERWQAWSFSTGLLGSVVLEPELAEPWRVAPGLDVALDVAIAFAALMGEEGPDFVAAASPLPVLELLACGVPVIMGHAGVLPRALGDNAGVIPVPSGDRVAVARHLMRLHDDADLRYRAGEAAIRAMRQAAEQARFLAGMRDALADIHGQARRGGGQSARNAIAAS